MSSLETVDSRGTNALVSLPDGTLTLESMGRILSASGFFTDINSVSRGIVKILVGREMGFSPMVSVMNIHIVKGKPMIGAILMASKIKESEKYKYRPKESTREKCVLSAWERDSKNDPWEPLPDIEFTIQEAKAAGLKVNDPDSNWAKWPKLMLHWRCIGIFCRVYCPELLAGCAAYTADEMGLAMDPQTGMSMESDTLPSSQQPAGIQALVDREKAKAVAEPPENAPVPPDAAKYVSPAAAAANRASVEPKPKEKKKSATDTWVENKISAAAVDPAIPAAGVAVPHIAAPVETVLHQAPPAQTAPVKLNGYTIDPEGLLTPEMKADVEEEINNSSLTLGMFLTWARAEFDVKMYFEHARQKHYQASIEYLRSKRAPVVEG